MSYSLTLGPEHPAWRGQQRYQVDLAGEVVGEVEFSNEQRMRGWAERLLRADLPDTVVQASRLCPNCGVAHGLACALALEQLYRLEPLPRGQALRCAAAELERAVAHIGAAARTLAALGMFPTGVALNDLALAMQQVVQQFGSVAIGGMQRDLQRTQADELLVTLPKLNRSLFRVIDGLIDNQPLLTRTIEVAVLSKSAAEQFGVRGVLARASGIGLDLRSDHPYEIYAQLPIRVIIQEGGDLYARLVVLLLEGLESVKLAEQIIRELPNGAVKPTKLPELIPGQAQATVEAPCGPLRYLIETNGTRLTRVVADPPRQLDRLLARTLLVGALIDNIVAIIAAVDHCPFCAGLSEWS